MGADPDPVKAIAAFKGQGPIIVVYPRRPKLSHLFEMEGWMSRIGLHQSEVFVGYAPNRLW
jgi:hypothetical protein